MAYYSIFIIILILSIFNRFHFSKIKSVKINQKIKNENYSNFNSVNQKIYR